MNKLENKTVLITGGLCGIGIACAMAAAKEGANVAVADIRSNNMDCTMEEIKNENSKAIFLECDISEMDELEATVQQVVSTFGTLDIAFNNAFICGEPSNVNDLTVQAWLKLIGINLNGVFNCMKIELAQMAKQGNGVIVNTSSILGKIGFNTSSHYIAAMNGVIGLTRAAALDYDGEGIRINALCPGYIETPLPMSNGIDNIQNMKQFHVPNYPMQRLGNSEDIASGFIFLACNDSSFMTGSMLEIDGDYITM